MYTHNWLGCGCNFWINCLTIAGSFLFPRYALTQLVPDATLGTENSVATPQIIKEISSDRIDGGAIRGNNLFHSFQEFNIPEGRGVYFTNPAAIDRILTRVTGGNVSQILGTLGVLGNADLFLINPNGIIFGVNARLDLNGSFIGSTASSIQFANGIEFSATNPQTPPLLNISVPLGLQYGANPASIIDRSTDRTAEPTLQVPLGRTFALVGGDVLFEGGTMKASQGRIELGSVGENSFVNLTPIAQGWALNYDRVQNFRDITLSQSAIVDASGEAGGDIQVRARRLTLSEGAVIYYSTASQAGGNIEIATSESVELFGGINPAFEDPVPTQISAFTQGTGATGNLTVKTRQLTIRDGGGILNVSTADGRAGNLTVIASESVEAIGTVPDDPDTPSGLFAQAFSTGNGGDLTVETRRLIVRDGAFLTTNTYNAGQAGNLTVRASESVELIGTNPDPGLAGGIGSGVNPDPLTGEPATGNSGTLTIETKRLTIQGGGQIASSTLSEGNAGDAIVNASESIELIGTRPEATSIQGSSGLFVSAEEGSTGKVGDLRINTGSLLVRDGARISADNFGPNIGGSLTINADRLLVRDGGTVRAGSFGDGSGGALIVNASDLVQVTGTGTIGNENINSSLFTQAQASGAAGNLSITAASLRVADSGEVTVGSVGTGAAGNLNINARFVDLNRGGSLRAESTAGLGNIEIKSGESLILRGNSGISTNSKGSDPGGNISIATANLVALENSDITANAANNRGGQVTIDVSGIFGTQFRDLNNDFTSDITASSELGAQFSGTVQISTPDVDPSSGLVELPANVVDVEGLVDRNFCTPQQVANGSFVVTGRGGLPANPIDSLGSEIVAVEWARRDRAYPNSQRTQREKLPFTAPNAEIVEAQGWIVSADGAIVLTAQAPMATPQRSSLTVPSCATSAIDK